MLKIYKQSNNGEVGLTTNCIDVDDFLSQLSKGIVEYLDKLTGENDTGNAQRDMHYLLTNAFELACKIKGYKCERVLEQRMLWAGDHWPPESSVPDVAIA